MKYIGFLSIIPFSVKANLLQSLSQEKNSSRFFTLSSNLIPAAADLKPILPSLHQSHRRSVSPLLLFPPIFFPPLIFSIAVTTGGSRS